MWLRSYGQYLWQGEWRVNREKKSRDEWGICYKISLQGRISKDTQPTPDVFCEETITFIRKSISSRFLSNSDDVRKSDSILTMLELILTKQDVSQSACWKIVLSPVGFVRLVSRFGRWQRHHCRNWKSEAYTSVYLSGNTYTHNAFWQRGLIVIMGDGDA